MKLRVSAHGVELSNDLKEYIRRRVHFSMGRFAGKIRFLSIRLTDLNGPRGGVDKCCDIQVDAGFFHKRLVVHERQASVQAAVALATERAERTFRRRLSMARGAEKRVQTVRTNFGN